MRPKKVRSIFGRFIAASCIPTKRTKGTIPADLRLILCDIIQYSVLEAMKELGQYKFIEKFSDSEFATKTLIFDIDRAHAWTTMLSSEAWNGLHIDKETRPALF
jgi:hypothetical protein